MIILKIEPATFETDDRLQVFFVHVGDPCDYFAFAVLVSREGTGKNRNDGISVFRCLFPVTVPSDSTVAGSGDACGPFSGKAVVEGVEPEVEGFVFRLIQRFC